VVFCRVHITQDDIMHLPPLWSIMLTRFLRIYFEYHVRDMINNPKGTCGESVTHDHQLQPEKTASQCFVRVSEGDYLSSFFAQPQQPRFFQTLHSEQHFENVRREAILSSEFPLVWRRFL